MHCVWVECPENCSNCLYCINRCATNFFSNLLPALVALVNEPFTAIHQVDSKLPSDSVSVWLAREHCCTTNSHLVESIPFEALRVQILT